MLRGRVSKMAVRQAPVAKGPGQLTGAAAGGVAAAASTPAGAAVRGGGADTGTASPAVALATTVASNPVLCTELSEVNTIVSDEPLDVTADALLPDSVASTGALLEPPSYSRKMS